MKVKIFSSFLTASALLFSVPVLSTIAQQEINHSHVQNTSIQEERVNFPKTKDFFDDLRGLFNVIALRRLQNHNLSPLKLN